MNYMNRGSSHYLNEKIMREMLKGGPAIYRSIKVDGHPEHIYELRQESMRKPFRLLSVKLPGLPHLRVKLPRWAPVGTLTT